MEYQVKIEKYYGSRYCDCCQSQRVSDEFNFELFKVHDLDESSEDAIIDRDLFDAYDYIKALNKEIELAKQGYDKVTYKEFTIDNR